MLTQTEIAKAEDRGLKALIICIAASLYFEMISLELMRNYCFCT